MQKKKICWNCRFFGKCIVQNKSCKDWEIFTETEVVGNVDQFALEWLRIHNSGFFKMKLDPEIMNVRRQAFRKWEEGDEERS